MKLNENVFSNLDSETEYWLGFFYADGNIYKRSQNSFLIRLELKREDENHIRKFRSFMGSNHKVSFRSRELGETCLVGFRNTKIAKDLAKYGIKPNKTKNACPSENLKESRHFWRGVIDGDGSIFDDRGYPTLDLYGNKQTVEGFYDWQNTKSNSSIFHKENSTYNWRVTGSFASDIISRLYIPSDNFLERKKKRAIKLVN